MSYTVDFNTVSTVGLESSPVAPALAEQLRSDPEDLLAPEVGFEARPLLHRPTP